MYVSQVQNDDFILRLTQLKRTRRRHDDGIDLLNTKINVPSEVEACSAPA
jgi:hypothetical protein